MSVFKKYQAGAEVLGDGALPWMSLISNIAQGVTGVSNDGKKKPDTATEVQKALAEERAKQEAAKKKSRTTMLVVGLSAVGVLGVVGVTALVVRRKK